MLIFRWSCALPSAMKSNLCWECTKGENPFALLRWGYTTSILELRVNFRVIDNFRFSVLVKFLFSQHKPSATASGVLKVTWPFGCRAKYCSTTRIPSLSITGHHPRATGGLVGGVLPLRRGAVGVFYSPSR